MTDLVIGSGPAGLAVAAALLARGRTVTMIDGGRVLAAVDEVRRDALAAGAPETWDPAALAAFRAPAREAQRAAPAGAIRRFGSDFAVSPPEETFADPPAWFGLRASLATGGLGNVWGAAVLPYAQADMAGWPVTAADLAPHLAAVTEFLPVAGREDGLQTLFPTLAMAGRTPLPPSPQGAGLLARLDRAAPALRAMGVTHGQARQAVRAAACRRCGLCLAGCPWGLIFAPGPVLARLRGNPRFAHLPGRVATGFAEEGRGVRVTLEGGGALAADRLFLAAGVLGTARLVLAALPGLGELVLADSQQFFTPFLHPWAAPADPEGTPHHTLAQAFLEIADPRVSPFLVHAQIYAWNDAYERELRARYGWLPIPGGVFRALARRLIVAQGFLNSAHSHRIALTLAPGDARGRLAARLVANPETPQAVARARARIVRALGRAGLVGLGPAGHAGPPGSSFHCGASLPMRAEPHGTPRGAESDPLGRPAGLTRVHVVDASVLPAIPATTITLPVMANAHRIGSLAP